MRKCLQFIFLQCVRLCDFVLQHSLRDRYKRVSNQCIRTAYHYTFYSYLLDRYRTVAVPKIPNDGPIWMFWWQGQETMPPMVQRCYELAICHAPENHPVILLTRDNYQQYADIPRHIVEKVKNKRMTLTHFSDILRVVLLAEHGGLWMDATLFSTNYIPTSIFEKDFFSVRTPDDGEYVSRCLWTGFFMGGVKGHPLFCFMRDLFFDYWKEHNVLIDYFMIDLGIAMAYDTLLLIKRSIDEGVLCADKLHKLMPIMGEPVDVDAYNAMTSEWPFYKMTWRMTPPRVMPDGRYTVYGYMLK